MTATGKRFDWVDMAKGVSILLVVMMHSAYGVGEETGGVGVLHWIIGFATPFRMPEFFMISGLFLSQVVGRDWSRFADRRVVHYLYFYVVWAVIHIVFKVALVAHDPVGAVGALAVAVVEPYGVLWFIYMLAVFSALVKLAHALAIPHWVMLAVGAVLQMSATHTGIDLIDEFSAYAVYFYAGYCAAPLLFRLVEWAQDNVTLALAGLFAWALINGALVFSPGFALLPKEMDMGLAALPGLRLLLAIAGSSALCVLAALLAKVPAMDWLRWLGSKSIVVYLAFALPMSIARTLLLKLGFTDTSVVSILVMATAVLASLALYWLVEATGFGKALYERPGWAHLPGTNGARSSEGKVPEVAAE